MPRCKVCRSRDVIKIGLLHFCGFDHAVQYAEQNKAKGMGRREKAIMQEQKRLAREDKIRHRNDRQSIKTLEKLCQEAQYFVNRYVRLRDEKAYGTCICCDKPEITDAGHFHAVGSKYRTSRLRLNPDQIHGCCAKCNRFIGGGNQEGYKMGLIVRYGESKLAELEALKVSADSGKDAPLTREEVADIKKRYSALCRQLEKSS